MANAGLRGTIRAFKFALAWGLATAELHREPESVEELAQVMKLSRATAFRDQAAFRKAFPGEVSPSRMNEVTGQQARYNDLHRTLSSVGERERAAEASIFTLGANEYRPA